MTASNFVGRIYIEGTLATNPQEEDWFAITFPDVTTAYIDYAQPSTGVRGFNFKGSFAWIRARQDRDYLGLEGLTQNQLGAYGYIDNITLNMGTWQVDQNLGGGTPSISIIESVRGNNQGSGESIYAGSVGQTNVLLNFRTLVAGNGVTLSTTGQTITINSTGEGDSGSGSGSSTFTGLTDTPNEITNKGILIGGQFGVLQFVEPPTATNQILTNTANGVSWVIPANQDFSVLVKNEGTSISAAKTINFVGDGVQVINDGTNIARVIIGADSNPGLPSNTEFVTLQYTAGNSGNFNSSDVVVDTSPGVTVSIVDPVNCIVAFTFTNRLFPPSAVALMGQAYATNEFNYSNVTSAIATRKVASGGTAASPTLMGSFSGPITLQLRMNDAGASAGAGMRAKVIVMFRF